VFLSFCIPPVTHVFVKINIGQGLFPTDASTSWDGKVTNPFIYWFCDTSDFISSFLVSMIIKGMGMNKKKGVPNKFVELASNHSATISLLEVWNWYGHWVPLNVNLNKNMPYLFYYCAFEYIIHMTDTDLKKISFPRNVYSNVLTVVRTFFYLANTSKLITCHTNDYEHFFQQEHVSSTPDTVDGNYMGLTKLGLQSVQHFGPKFSFHQSLFAPSQNSKELNFDKDGWSVELSLLEALQLLLDSSYKGNQVPPNKENYLKLDEHLWLVKDYPLFMKERNNTTWQGRFMGKSGASEFFYEDIKSVPDITESTRLGCLGHAKDTILFLAMQPTKAFTDVNYDMAKQISQQQTPAPDTPQGWEPVGVLATKSPFRGPSNSKNQGGKYLPKHLIQTTETSVDAGWNKKRQKYLEEKTLQIALSNLVSHFQHNSENMDGYMSYMNDADAIQSTIGECIEKYGRQSLNFSKLMGPGTTFGSLFPQYDKLIPLDMQKEEFSKALNTMMKTTLISVKQESVSALPDAQGNMHPVALELDSPLKEPYILPRNNKRQRLNNSETSTGNDNHEEKDTQQDFPPFYFESDNDDTQGFTQQEFHSP
jgi:hypothetical protein